MMADYYDVLINQNFKSLDFDDVVELVNIFPFYTKLPYEQISNDFILIKQELENELKSARASRALGDIDALSDYEIENKIKTKLINKIISIFDSDYFKENFLNIYTIECDPLLKLKFVLTFFNKDEFDCFIYFIIFYSELGYFLNSYDVYTMSSKYSFYIQKQSNSGLKNYFKFYPYYKGNPFVNHKSNKPFSFNNDLSLSIRRKILFESLQRDPEYLLELCKIIKTNPKEQLLSKVENYFDFLISSNKLTIVKYDSNNENYAWTVFNRCSYSYYNTNNAFLLARDNIDLAKRLREFVPQESLKEFDEKLDFFDECVFEESPEDFGLNSYIDTLEAIANQVTELILTYVDKNHICFGTYANTTNSINLHNNLHAELYSLDRRIHLLISVLGNLNRKYGYFISKSGIKKFNNEYNLDLNKNKFFQYKEINFFNSWERYKEREFVEQLNVFEIADLLLECVDPTSYESLIKLVRICRLDCDIERLYREIDKFIRSENLKGKLHRADNFYVPDVIIPRPTSIELYEEVVNSKKDIVLNCLNCSKSYKDLYNDYCSSTNLIIRIPRNENLYQDVSEIDCIKENFDLFHLDYNSEILKSKFMDAITKYSSKSSTYYEKVNNVIYTNQTLPKIVRVDSRLSICKEHLITSKFVLLKLFERVKYSNLLILLDLVGHFYLKKMFFMSKQSYKKFYGEANAIIREICGNNYIFAWYIDPKLKDKYIPSLPNDCSKEQEELFKKLFIKYLTFNGGLFVKLVELSLDTTLTRKQYTYRATQLLSDPSIPYIYNYYEQEVFGQYRRWCTGSVSELNFKIQKCFETLKEN